MNIIDKKLNILLITLSLSLPLIAFAVNIGPEPGIVAKSISIVVNDFMATALSVVWIVAGGITIIMFALAGIKFLLAQGNPQGVAEARQAVIWGVVGALIVVLAWSIIAIAKGTLKV